MIDESGVSVVICCHNSAARLPETLRHLAKQCAETPWEVVLVNNASTDDTVATASKTWTALGSPIRLRIVDEPIAGLSHARECGISNSSYNVIIFVDDDNWLADDYLRTAREIIAGNRAVGALGGKISLEYEQPPPQWFEEVQANFAVGAQSQAIGDITNEKPFLAGAGLVLRKSAYEDLVRAGFKFLLSGRKGSKASSGEDTELCYALAIRGYRIWYDDRLKLKHFMPARRLTTAAAFDLNRNINKGAVYCSLYAMVLKKEAPSPVRQYLDDVCRAAWWSIKALVKFLLGRQHFVVVRLQLQSFLVRSSQFPGYIRAFHQHYSQILALQATAQS